MLPEKAIQEFQDLYRRKFGEDLGNEEARKMAEHLYGLFCAVFGPPTPGKITQEDDRD